MEWPSKQPSNWWLPLFRNPKTDHSMSHSLLIAPASSGWKTGDEELFDKDVYALVGRIHPPNRKRNPYCWGHYLDRF